MKKTWIYLLIASGSVVSRGAMANDMHSPCTSCRNCDEIVNIAPSETPDQDLIKVHPPHERFMRSDRY